MEKDLITTNLLGIRAGLSMISKNTDEIKDNEDSIANEEGKIKNYHNKINDAEFELERYKGARRKEREQDLRYINNFKAKCDEEKFNENYYLEKSKHIDFSLLKLRWRVFWISVGSLFGLVIALFGLGYLIELFSGPLSFSDAFLEIIPPVVVFGPFVIALLITFIDCVVTGANKQKVTNLDAYKKHQNFHSQYTRWLSDARKALEKFDSDTEKEVREKEAEIARLKEALPAKIAECKDEISKYKEAITSIAVRSKVIATALNDTYGVFLSESDWQNVDLIIHYVETGRADDMKEALQLVDRQRQTDQIVHAIKAASQAICGHIESAFARMGAALGECFSRLDSRLQTISMQLDTNRRESLAASSALLDKLNEQKKATQMNTEALERINYSTQMSNALLEKANESSDELLNDLRYNQRFWVK